MLKLKISRFSFQEKCTIGHLFINDESDSSYFTLEDKVRSEKIFGETAIPAGTYSVVVDFSDHFNRLMPHILSVPGFNGIRIHSGNTDLDTEGCILVGSTWNNSDFIGNSREAFESLFKLIQEADSVQLEVS